MTPSKSTKRQTVLSVARWAGVLAEDKDVALRMRLEDFSPALKAGQVVVLDFNGVILTTQSFVHALLSEVIRHEGTAVLDRIRFKNCNPLVKSLIRTVVEYSQETEDHRQ